MFLHMVWYMNKVWYIMFLKKSLVQYVTQQSQHSQKCSTFCLFRALCAPDKRKCYQRTQMILAQKRWNLDEVRNRNRTKEITHLICQVQRHISVFCSCGSSMVGKIWKRDLLLQKVQSWVSTLPSHSHISQALMSDKTPLLFLA